MKIAVQGRGWLMAPQALSLADMMQAAARAGYAGLEIGEQFVDLDRPLPFRRMAEACGLQVAGIHLGGAIFDAESVRRARANVERIAEFAQAVGASYLAYSGIARANKPPSETAVEAGNLNRVGEICDCLGLRLAYHNHDWEVLDNFCELQALCDQTEPRLVWLCLDTGWVQRAGGQPAQAIRRFGRRIACLHLRDDAAQLEWKPLGQGEIDYPALFAAAVEVQPQWLTVEPDGIVSSPDDFVQVSRTFIHNLMGW